MKSTTQCCIAGGGPAGLVLGFLLARAGVDVLVLEKHADYLRDFRGDTVHPSTLEVLYELGLLERFLALSHQEVPRLSVTIEDTEVGVADFSRLPTHCKFIALMPQWDLLNFIEREGRIYPNLRIEKKAEVIDLTFESGRVSGVVVRTEEGEHRVAAGLVVGCDGRHSTVRERAGLIVQDFNSTIDVLWMRIGKVEGDDAYSLGHLRNFKMMVTIDRGDYWQCAYILKKGGFDAVRAAGIEHFRADLKSVIPHLSSAIDALTSWDQVSLLSVRVDRLVKWAREGLVCIGDAAHAMSPVGGVGINLAIQDAIATARLLHGPLRANAVTLSDLDRIQTRRQFATRVIQAAQVTMHNRVVIPYLSSHEKARVPWPLKLIGRWPLLQQFPARAVGIGIRPEHIDF